MATKRIETQLTIKAVDQYSGALKNMRTVTGRFADGVRTEMSRLQDMRGPLKLIEDFRRQQQVLRQSGESLEQARERVRQLKQAITSTHNPTAQMRREFERARNAADRLEEKHQQNRQALSGLKSQLRQAGVNTGDLAGEQRRLAGTLDGASTAFGRQMERMRRLETMQTRIAAGRERMERSLATAANLSFVGGASMQTGRRILTGVSAPVQQAVEFETAMSDVKKVVDFDTPEAFQKMSDDILELSTRIPIAADGLAQIVAAGGQSGIAQDELARFAEMAAKIGVAFDISADYAGTSMAEIKTALSLTLDETGALFDAINYLSNNSAAKADKTLSFLNRAGSFAAGYGFSDTETLAIGAAMISAGAGADTAATSFMKLGQALTRGESATTRQAEAMQRLGLDAGRVARDMQQDAVGTTADVLQRLRELPEHMRASVMSDLFGDEARELTKLINNAELLPQLLGMISDERKYLGSAEKEYAARAETTANNLQLMRNQMARLGITVGEVVLPPLNDLLEMSQGIINRMVTWAKENPKLTKWLVIGAGAVGAMAVAGGALLTAAAGLIGTLAVLRFGLVGFGARAAFAAGDLVGVGSAFRSLTRLPKFALSKLLTPLRWTARLLPDFGPALARFVGFRSDAAREISQLADHVDLKSKSMSRSLSGIRWGRLFKFAGLAGAAYTALQPTELGDGTVTDDVRNMNPDKIRESQIRGMYAVPTDLPDQQKNAAEVVQDVRRNGELPTEAARDSLRGSVFSIQSEIARMRAEIDNLGASPADVAMASSLQQTIRSRQAELQKVRQELAAAEALASDLTAALQLLNETNTAPEINTESIDRAIDRIVELATRMEVLPYAGIGPRPVARPAGSGQRPVPKPAGARASGGPVRAFEPYLVNENTPRSEWFVPSQSGGILNVSQAQSAFHTYLASSGPGLRDAAVARLNGGAQRIRAVSLAALSATAIALPAAADAPSDKPTSNDVRVEINGGINIQVPSGVSDPQAIADLIFDQIGQRVAATMSASYSD